MLSVNRAMLFHLIFFVVIFQAVTLSQNSVQNLERPLKPCWEKPLEAVDLKVSKERLILVLPEGLEAIEAKSGDILWKTLYGGKILSVSEELNDKIAVVYATNYKPVVRLISAVTGLSIWQRELNLEVRQEKVFVFKTDKNVIVATGNGYIKALNEDGQVVWERQVGQTTNALLSNGLLLLTSESGRVLILSLLDGVILRSVELKTKIVGEAALLSDQLLFSNEEGYVFSYDLNEQRITWKTRLGGQAINLKKIGKRQILVSSNDNFVYLLSASDGDRLWKRRFEGRPVVKTIDRFAVVSDKSSNKVSVLSFISKKKVFISNTLELESEPLAVAFTDQIIFVALFSKLKAFSISC